MVVYIQWRRVAQIVNEIEIEIYREIEIERDII